MSSKLNKKGFTLIEVVLVLAIGGLIFLLAFLAFRQVTVNRRDTQRRADGARIIAELQNYYVTNGKYPLQTNVPERSASQSCTPRSPEDIGNFIDFLSVHMCQDGFFEAPDGNYATAHYNNALSSSSPVNKIRYKTNASCDYEYPGGDNVPGSVRVDIGLENGNWVCRDSKGR